jgi:LPS export ABC transporter permease LptG
MYWVFLITGENMADKTIIPPAVGMWAGNVFLIICGAVLIVLMTRETAIGFGFLKVSFGKLSPVFRRISGVWIFRMPGMLLRFPRRLLDMTAGKLPSYLIWIFLGYAVGLSGALIVIFVTVDYVSNIRKFDNAAFEQIILYYWYYLPFIVQTVLPIVLFLSSMFSMGRLAKSSELTAMKAAGVNVRQLTMPLMLLGLLLTGGVFYGGEMVLPHANERRALINASFGGKPANQQETGSSTQTQNAGVVREYRRNFFYFAAPGVMYSFNEFCTNPQFFRGVRRYTFTPGGLRERIDAAEAEFDGAGWRFVNGQARTFTGENVTAKNFETLPDSILTAIPADLVKRVKSKEAMSYWELSSYIEAAKRRGENPQKFMAELQFKIALPFMNFIVILFGLSLASRAGRRGGTALFGVGLLLSFLYWILSRFALVFAQNGYLPTLVGAWIGNVIFFIVGLILYRKAAH